MKIATSVLSTLSLSVTEGNALRLPPGQLERKHYEAVDKVLRECGGKWNRSKKVHLFDSDATERIEVILATGEITTAREIGFFPTPAALADELVQIAGVKPGDRVLEPSAGTGAIVQALLKAAHVIVVAIERDTTRRKTLMTQMALTNGLFVETADDFMDFRVLGGGTPFDRVVMNPPFCKVGKGDHLDHVRHAFSLLRPKGVLVSVLPSSVEFREDRRHKEFRAFVDEHTGEFTALPHGSFKGSGTAVSTCVLRMVK